MSEAKELFDKRVQSWAEADERLEKVLEHRFGHTVWVNRSEDGKSRASMLPRSSRPPVPEVVVR